MSSRRPAAKKAAAPATDPRFPHGPLAVLDGDGSAYGVGGIVLDRPATTVVELVEWTLRESGLGAPKLHRHGKDADPLIVLAAAAAAKLGLPERLEDRRGLRIPHPLVRLFVQEAALPPGVVDRRVLGLALRRCRVHRLRAQRAGVEAGHPVAGLLIAHRPGRRAQRGHELQAVDRRTAPSSWA